MINKTGKSYKQFQDVYYPLFDKMNNATDTIFENMDFRPPVDLLYEQFAQSDAFNAYISANSSLEKRYMIQQWILEHVFQDAYFDVKFKLITENESLPYNIEYKLNKSYDVIQEARPALSSILAAGLGAGAAGAGLMIGGPVAATLGFALGGLTVILGMSDEDRQNIVKTFEELGKFIGKLTTLNFDFIDVGTRKEILAALRADKLADNLDECIKITGFNPHETNKLTRFIQRITNSHKEYDYVQCVGTNLINFYISVLDAVYKILRSSDVDDKVFQVMEGGLKRGALNEALFRNLARLSRNKNVYRLLEVVNKVNDALNEIMDTLVHSADAEHSRIGHNLSKILDSELRNLAYKIHKDMISSQGKPALNRRNGADVMNDNNRFPSNSSHGSNGAPRDNRFPSNSSHGSNGAPRDNRFPSNSSNGSNGAPRDNRFPSNSSNGSNGAPRDNNRRNPF